MVVRSKNSRERAEDGDIAMQQSMCKNVFSPRAIVITSTIATILFLGQIPHAAQDAQPSNYLAPAIVNLNFCRPAYPREALLRSERGVVKLEFTVGVKGKLVGSRIVKSSGFRELDTAALTALLHCSFRPAYRNGVPVQASFTIDYTWASP
jgi:TonB family protein